MNLAIVIKFPPLWCESNNLILNVDKTKEMFIDFRKNVVDYDQSTIFSVDYINGKCVEIVNCFKFLGTQIADNLRWTTDKLEEGKDFGYSFYSLVQL